MKVNFEKILERDVDLLIINKLINDKNFINIFLQKIHKLNYQIQSIEHSVLNENGESDIIVVLQNNNSKIALLIEDKINALAMPNQHDRYTIRGNAYIEAGKYDEFFVFIIAPKSYLESNLEAKKYENQISYETLIEHFKDDTYAKTLLLQAIEEKKSGYTVIENTAVTNFWTNYYAYVKKYYPYLNLKEIIGPRGSRAFWPEFKTPIDNIKIIHKSNKGFVDLTFNNVANKYNIFYDSINEFLYDDMFIEKAGKSLVVRIKTPIIDFKQPFNNYLNEMKISLYAVTKLLNLLPKINLTNLYNK